MSKQLSAAAEKKVEELKKLYPDARSAVMPALYIAQEELGYVTDEAILWVSERVGIAPVHVREVATFYTMYYKKPVGKYHVQICRTLACALCGAKKLSKHLHEKLGINPGEISSDGMWSYEEVECLGSCGTGPMCQINDCYFENLSVEKFDALLTRIQKEQPDLRFSAVRDSLGAGLKGQTFSEVI
jgi:NADH-quinone oxidoreductase subunit E